MICSLTCDFIHLLTWFVKVIEIKSEEFLSARTHEIIPEVWLNNYCLYQHTGCPVRTLDTEHPISTSDCSETIMWLKSTAEESWSKAWVKLKFLKNISALNQPYQSVSHILLSNLETVFSMTHHHVSVGQDDDRNNPADQY